MIMAEPNPLPPPTAPPVAQPTTPAKRRSNESWIGLGAAALVVIGAFGPWLTASSVFGSASVSGFDGDGKITVVLAVTVAALFWTSFSTWIRIGRVLVAAGIVLTGGYDLLEANDRVESVDSEYVRASVGWGLWLTVGASAVALIMAFVSKD